MSVKITSKITVGEGNPLFLIAGPCVIESEQLVMDVAGQLKEWTNELKMPFAFKSSFDKANRTSIQSFRGPGMDKGLEILEKVKKTYGIPLLTDIHEIEQIKPVSKIVDIIQIPAFLCRQTDLLVAAGKSGKVVNVKKGQFLSPQEMKNIVVKVESTGNKSILLTERGSTFGYNNLVVDMRCLPIMRTFGYPVIFDATHSVQQPGGIGTTTGGDRTFIPYLACAAVAVGCDGVFMETHPNPEKAKSDGPNMLPLNQVKELLQELLELHALGNKKKVKIKSNEPEPDLFPTGIDKSKAQNDYIIIHTDGCSKGNPGEAGIGVVFTDPEGEDFYKKYLHIGETTNNIAEYTALLTALQDAQSQGFQRLKIYSDSELMVKQINGLYKVKDLNIKKLHTEVKNLWKNFQSISIQHIPREENTEADNLANWAIDNQ